MLSVMALPGIRSKPLPVALLLLALLPPLTGCGALGRLAERKDEPKAPTPSAPAGWTALAGGRFGYIVKRDWKLKPSGEIAAPSIYEDTAGQWQMKVEEFTGCGDPNRPDRLSSFSKGVDPFENLQTYTNDTAPSRMTVPGAAGGWRYELTGSTGRHYTVFNVWDGSKRHPCWSELWMTVLDDRETANLIADHFTAAPPPS
jgi:hypothetical protein